MKKSLPLIVLACLLPWLVYVFIGQSWVRILDFSLLYLMLSLGLNVVVGYAGLLDLGYIAFFAVGAYSYALLSSPQFGLHWPLLVILPIGALCAGVFGVLLGAPTLRLKGDYLAIVTLGFGEIIRIFLNNLSTPINITNGPQGISEIDPLHVGSFVFNHSSALMGISVPSVIHIYYLFLLAVIVAIVFSYRLEKSRVGRAWMAIREDELAASCVGIHTKRYKLLAFGLGATMGGLSGGLFAGFQEFVSPESFTLMESVMILCMVVLGGMGHIPGVIVGSLLLSVLPELLRESAGWQKSLLGSVWVDPANLRLIMFALALVIMMLLRPEGLIPSSVRKKELHHE
ncbi:MAG: ABC transporter ATP-binding protein [Betaproteobacteria bacterium]|nr:ABC transporter ATP-binding protein [Betaproteobacteria bacterium]